MANTKQETALDVSLQPSLCSQTSRCSQIDMTYMLGLESRRKLAKRGSFLSRDDIPKRSVVEANGIVDYLRAEGFTSGMARTLMRSTDDFPLRIWILDNSSSMSTCDGHRVVQNPHTHKIANISCTRREEVSSTILWHAKFAALMKAPTIFRLVNPSSEDVPQQVGIACTEQVEPEKEVKELELVLLDKLPEKSGGPVQHLREIVDLCLQADSTLLGKGSIAVILVTDRLPVDKTGMEGEAATQEFLEILQFLQHQPVWVVIRLSTDDPRVVDFYNDLDEKIQHMTVSAGSTEESIGQGGVHLDVLDDYVSEASSVYKHNPWLNYTYPLHLCRESAVSFPVFDVLNDRPLNHAELVDFLNLVFDRNQQAWAQQPFPNPETNYVDFRKDVKEVNRKGGTLYNPIRKRVMPWIDIGKLDQIYGPKTPKGCACIIM